MNSFKTTDAYTRTPDQIFKCIFLQLITDIISCLHYRWLEPGTLKVNPKLSRPKTKYLTGFTKDVWDEFPVIKQYIHEPYWMQELIDIAGISVSAQGLIEAMKRLSLDDVARIHHMIRYGKIWMNEGEAAEASEGWTQLRETLRKTHSGPRWTSNYNHA